MPREQESSARLQELVVAAAADRRALQIVGSGSKRFLGRESKGDPLDVTHHSGIVSYEPKELVVTARCGTPLAELEMTLAEQGQMLPFEPPHLGPAATLGGAIATGLSGPRRPYTGAVRDFVLGIRLLNGSGEIQRFGGEVMKNVAGYDISRLMTGAMGTLGVILDGSLKVVPMPAWEITLVQETTVEDAIRMMNTWAGQPLPLSGACYDGELLHLRLSGARSAVEASCHQMGGDPIEDGGQYWTQLREQQHRFFSQGSDPLWRLSVRPASPPMPLEGKWFIDWGGAQRWLQSSLPAAEIRQAATIAGGHATLFRGGDRNGEVFHPLSAALDKLHQRLKKAFDPQGLFNPGRLYPGF